MPTSSTPPFMGASHAESPQGFAAAIFGAPHGTPYPGINNRVHQDAPNAFRWALAEDSDWLDHWDFDLGKPLLSHGLPICDLGNLKTRSKDGEANRILIEQQTRDILEAGAVPIMFGGDDSVPIPFLAAFSNQPAIVILQIDAHIDWREERHGERFGFSSTMRRAEEGAPRSGAMRCSWTAGPPRPRCVRCVMPPRIPTGLEPETEMTGGRPAAAGRHYAAGPQICPREAR